MANKARASESERHSLVKPAGSANSSAIERYLFAGDARSLAMLQTVFMKTRQSQPANLP
jgi:hypothetical protein